MVAAHVMQATKETPTTVNSPSVKSTAVTSVLKTELNTHVSCVKTTSSTSKTWMKDSDTVNTVMMMTSTHTQPVEDVNATKLSSTTPMMSSATHVTVTLIIISLMDTAPLVDKTVTTVTSTVALSVTSDLCMTTLKLSVSTSAQLAQSSTVPATVDLALPMSTNTDSSTSYLTVSPQLPTALMKSSKEASLVPMQATTLMEALHATITRYTEVPMPDLSNSTTQLQSQIVDTGSTVNANSSLLKDLYHLSPPHTPPG